MESRPRQLRARGLEMECSAPLVRHWRPKDECQGLGYAFNQSVTKAEVGTREWSIALSRSDPYITLTRKVDSKWSIPVGSWKNYVGPAQEEQYQQHISMG